MPVVCNGVATTLKKKKLSQVSQEDHNEEEEKSPVKVKFISSIQSKRHSHTASQ